MLARGGCARLSERSVGRPKRASSLYVIPLEGDDMRSTGVILAIVIACAPSLVAEQQPDANAFAAALDNVRQELQGAPPFPCYAYPQGWKCSDPQPQDPRHMRELAADAIVVAQRTIGGAPAGYRAFVERSFGSVIAEELLQSYGDAGPASTAIERKTAGGFLVLALEQFAEGPFGYDWQRLNQKYPGVRWVVRVSWPAIDRLGTYAVVRYELIGRDRPSKWKSPEQPWQWGSFVKFEKQPDGSWKRELGAVGNIWN